MGYPRVSAKIKHVSIIIIKPKIILDYSRKSDYNTEPEAFADSINTFLEEKMKKTKRLLAILCVVLICAQLFAVTASAATNVYPPLPSLKLNEHGIIVKALQRMLNYANNAGLSVTGYFGSNTEKAVKNFQRRFALTVNGVVNEATWNRLTSKCQIQYGSNNDMVKLAQLILNQSGYNCGQVDGIFGNRTLKAVKNFQREWMGANEVDGIVGPKTWKHLLIAYYYDFD